MTLVQNPPSSARLVEDTAQDRHALVELTRQSGQKITSLAVIAAGGRCCAQVLCATDVALVTQ